ncbi:MULTISPECIES: prephenate dehydratase domain-containing protein [unclassified Staphylococcus]|uniref:prephenate dehydratase n=1 Tax=unclassified Staphylococcus TaxID=91994 RepID=UPI0021D0B8B6|nr:MULTISPECIES: prephenate dehydratase domain-containing protein [unclassified Staphylococcus]UXR77773.1 prephenate dehydratase [Staphylococcus sp. IVB6227]UXR81932.1 prephenate dehydratase [Staphylococcus sp. IVB6214]
MNLYYLGPQGTFSYLAAKQYCDEQPQNNLVAKTQLYEVMTALLEDPTSRAIVPIENAIEGTINIVADTLVEQPFTVVDEVLLDITFGLYGKPEQALDDIQKVYSIGPAISQTQKFIHQHHLSYDYTTSTIAALDHIDEATGAIIPLGSGEVYGYVPLATHIEDYAHNQTRFLVLQHADFTTQESGDTCLLVITPKQDQPGLLASVLNTFALFHVNLSWIESRPLKTQLGMYRFFVQADCPSEHALNKIITILETLDFEIQSLGRFN